MTYGILRIVFFCASLLAGIGAWVFHDPDWILFVFIVGTIGIANTASEGLAYTAVLVGKSLCAATRVMLQRVRERRGICKAHGNYGAAGYPFCPVGDEHCV